MAAGYALGAVFNAYRDRVPLVIVAGQQARSLIQLRPFLGADEPALFPRPYVKYPRQPERAEDVPAVLAEAYRVAMAPPRGPVFVSVPEDDWDRPAEHVAPRAAHSGLTAAPAALDALAARLETCARPALVVGPGVDDEDALDQARVLAERPRAAVWISPLSGRSGFPESHPLFQGFLPPLARALSARLAPYDVAVALGAPVFTYHVADGGPPLAPGTELFHLDCDPGQAAWLPTGTSIVTTLRPALTRLTGLLKETDREPPPPRPVPPPAPADGDVTPELLLDLLRARLPRDRVLVEEAPSHRDALHARVPVASGGGFLTTGSGALGWGLPLAVGRALADRRRVVCVVGDGSAMYSVQARWSAARHTAPASYVLLDNGGYAAVRALGRRIGLPAVPGTDITGIDFPALAESLGCPAARAEQTAELPAALDRALGLDDDAGPFLLLRGGPVRRPAPLGFPLRIRTPAIPPDPPPKVLTPRMTGEVGGGLYRSSRFFPAAATTVATPAVTYGQLSSRTGISIEKAPSSSGRRITIGAAGAPNSRTSRSRAPAASAASRNSRLTATRSGSSSPSAQRVTEPPSCTRSTLRSGTPGSAGRTGPVSRACRKAGTSTTARRPSARGRSRPE